MANTGLSVDHLRRFSITSNREDMDVEEKRTSDRNSSCSRREDMFSDSQSRRYRRKKMKKRKKKEECNILKKSNNTANGANNTSNEANNTSNGANNTSNEANNTSNGENNTANGANNTSNGENNTANGANNTSNEANNTSNGANNTCNEERRYRRVSHSRKHASPKLNLSIPAEHANGEISTRPCQTTDVRAHEYIGDSHFPNEGAQILPRKEFDETNVKKEAHPKEHPSSIRLLSKSSITDNIYIRRLEFLLKIHLRFCSFGIITNGLVAGLALTQCIFVFSFSKKSDLVLTTNYSELSLLFQSLYYFLLAISTVSIFDKYIKMRWDWSEFLQHLIAKPARGISLVSYLLALIFSVSLAQLDEKLSMTKSSPSLTATHHQIDNWKILNLLRVISSITGWISISLVPNDDLTVLSINGMIEKEKENDLLNRAGSNLSPLKMLIS